MSMLMLFRPRLLRGRLPKYVKYRRYILGLDDDRIYYGHITR